MTKVLQALIEQYSSKFNLDPDTVRVILERVDIEEGFKLPSKALNEAINSGKLGRNPDLNVLEGRVEAATAYLSTLDSKRKTDSDDIFTTASAALSLNENDLRKDYSNILVNREAYQPSPAGSPVVAGNPSETGYASIDGVSTPIVVAPTANPVSRPVDPTNLIVNDNSATASGSNQNSPIITGYSYGESSNAGNSSSTTNQATSGFRFGDSLRALDEYNLQVAQAQKDIDERQKELDKQNKALSSQVPNVDQAFADKGTALNESANAVQVATDDLNQGLDDNQARKEEAFQNTYNLSNLDVNDPNHNSRVNAVLAEQSALTDSAVAGSAAARKVREASPLSRRGLGRMIFGNIYSQGVKETTVDSNNLATTYNNLMAANQTALDATLINNVSESSLKAAYESTVNAIEYKNKAKVFQATSGVASFAEKAKIQNTLNASATKAIDNRLKVLELEGKKVDTAVTLADLRIKEADLVDRANSRSAATIERRAIAQQRAITLRNSTQAGNRANTEHLAKTASGAFDAPVLAAQRGTRVATSETERIQAEVKRQVVGDPLYQSTLATNLVEENNARTSEIKANLQQNTVVYKKATLALGWYQNGGAGVQQKADLLKVQESLSQLQANRVALQGIDLTANARAKLLLEQKQIDEKLDLIKLKQEAGYNTRNVAVTMAGIENKSINVNNDLQAHAQLIDAYTLLTGYADVGNIPAKIQKDPKLQVALLSTADGGSFHANPYKAITLAKEILPPELALKVEEVGVFLDSQTKSLAHASIDPAKNDISTQNFIKSIVSGKTIKFKIHEANPPALGFNKMTDVMDFMGAVDPDGDLVKLFTDEFIKAYNSALTPIDKMNEVYKAMSIDESNLSIIGANVSKFAKANVMANNANKRFATLGMGKQKGMKYYNRESKGFVETLVDLPFDTANLITGLTSDTSVIDFTDGGDIIALIRSGQLTK